MPHIDERPARSHVQWDAVVAGALAGFAATVIMATLGAAIGISAGAILADSSTNGYDAGKAAIGMGIGAGVWMLLSGIVAGTIGGAVLNRMARYDRPYLPVSFSLLTWAGGVFLALVVAASGTMGLGGAAAGAAGAAARTVERRPLDAAERASKAAAAAAWVALASQLLSLGATILAARSSRVREIPVRVGPQLT